MTEQELMNQIINDALLSAAYKLGSAHGYRRGFEEGQISMEDWYQDTIDHLLH